MATRTQVTPDTTTTDAIREQLTATRHRHGLTQTELAERLGVTQPAVARMESAGTDLRLSTVERWAEALDVTIDTNVATAGYYQGPPPTVVTDGVLWLYASAPPNPFDNLAPDRSPGVDDLQALCDGLVQRSWWLQRRRTHILLRYDPQHPGAHTAIIGVQVRPGRDLVACANVFAEHGFTVLNADDLAEVTAWIGQLAAGTAPEGRCSVADVTAIQVGSPSYTVELAKTGAWFATSVRCELDRGVPSVLDDAVVTIAAPALPSLDGTMLRAHTGTAHHLAITSMWPGPGAAPGVTHQLAPNSISLLSPTAIGDTSGVFLGTTSPGNTPLYLDPGRASRANRSAVTLINGRPGSGGEHLAEALAVANADRGVSVIVRTRPHSNTVDGAAALHVSSTHPGLFDPFAWMDEHLAGEAAGQLLADLDPTRADELRLAARTATLHGGGSFITLLHHLAVASVDVPTLHGPLLAAVGARSEQAPVLDALTVVGFSPGVEAEAAFESYLDVLRTNGATAAVLAATEAQRANVLAQLDEHSELDTVHIGLAALACHCMFEALARSDTHGPKMLVIDEADVLAGHPVLDLITRQARSVGIDVVLNTTGLTAPADYGTVSRSFVFPRGDHDSAIAALHIAGIDPTIDRVHWLTQSSANLSTSGDRRAMALHRDLDGRHAAIVIGPVSGTWTTDPTRRPLLDEPTDATNLSAVIDPVPGRTYDLVLADDTRLQQRLLLSITADLDRGQQPTGAVSYTWRSPSGVTETIPGELISELHPAQ